MVSRCHILRLPCMTHLLSSPIGGVPYVWSDRAVAIAVTENRTDASKIA